MSRVQLARQVADAAVATVLAEYAERRKHPLWWAHFHAAMEHTLPRGARVRRAWHRMWARRYAAMVAADLASHLPAM